jgi:hypothetical protein
MKTVKVEDYPVLRKQIGDYHSIFYGPHGCEGCGVVIVKQALEQGANSWEECNEGEKFIPHHCTHIYLFKKLAGQVLTVVEAAFTPASPQLKAVKDLLRRDFSGAIATARQLEGDRCMESMGTLESIANN